jgi:hypothetical protein
MRRHIENQQDVERGWIQHDFKSKFNSSNNIIINYLSCHASQDTASILCID